MRPEIDDFYPDADEDDALLTKWAPEPEEENTIPSVPEQPVRRKGAQAVWGYSGRFGSSAGAGGRGVIAGTIGNRILPTMTDDSQLREYDTFLTPVVMQDPAPFESIEKRTKFHSERIPVENHYGEQQDKLYRNTMRLARVGSSGGM